LAQGFNYLFRFGPFDINGDEDVNEGQHINEDAVVNKGEE